MSAHMVTAHVDGETYSIPDIWLVGATHEDRRNGVDPRTAYARALRRWHEQAMMERDYLAEHDANGQG
jgi:hypothetical protein